MITVKRVALRALLLQGLAEYALAIPTAPDAYTGSYELITRATDPSSPDQGGGSCPRLDNADHQVVIDVGEALTAMSTKDKVLAAWQGIDKVQLVAAMTSILGEASLGKILLHDDAAVTDGLLAVPTVLVSLLGGVQALSKLMDKENPGAWKGMPGLDMLEFGTQASIWTVSLILMFESVLTTGFNGVVKPHHYTWALMTHSGFLALNLAQAAWEMAKDSKMSAGTGKVMDTLKLAGWRASYKTKRMMSGVANFASKIFRRQQTAVDQAGNGAVKLDHFVPLTRELARIALEVGAVNQCMMDSAAFHDRTAKLQGNQLTPAQCRAQWKDKFGHIYQNSGPPVGNEDTALGSKAEMISLTTLKDMTGGSGDSSDSMLQAIIMDAAGNIVPALVFAAMVAVTGGHSDAHGAVAGTAIFGVTTALQSLFLGKSSKALYEMFKESSEDNPKAKELADSVNNELAGGSLKEWGDLGVEIDVMVLSSGAQDYERHQGRFSIHNCPEDKQKGLEAELLKLATEAKVLRPEVFADTPQRFFGKMFRYSRSLDSGASSSNSHARRDYKKDRRNNGNGGARVMTWDAFSARFDKIDIGVVFEHLQITDSCVTASNNNGKQTRGEAEDFVPWSLRPENRRLARRENVEVLEEDATW